MVTFPSRSSAISPRILTFLIATLLFHAHTALATTKTFDDTSTQLVYGPTSAWSTVTDSALAGGSAHSTTSAGATASFSFSGQQVIIIGSAAGAFEVSVDGTAYQESGGQLVGSTLFSLQNLDQTATHTVVLTALVDGQALAIDQIKVAFVTSLGLIPSLVVDASTADSTSSTLVPTSSHGVNSSTSLGGSSAARFTTITRTATAGFPPSSSVLATSLTSSHSTSATPTGQTTSTSTHAARKVGLIVGATLGSIGGLAFVILAALLLRKRWKRRIESGYWDQDTGKGQRTGPQGFIAGGTRHSFNQTQPGLSNEKTSDVPTVMVTSSTESDGGWLGTLTRTGSWKRKLDRLRETRRFYGLGHSNSTQTLSASGNSHERGSLQFPSRTVLAQPFEHATEPRPAMEQVASSLRRPISFFSFPKPPAKSTSIVSSSLAPPPPRPITPPSRYASGLSSVTFSPIADPTITRPTPQTPTRSFQSSKRTTEMSPSTTYSPNRDSILRYRNASQDYGKAPLPPPMPPSAFQRLVKSAESRNSKKASKQSKKGTNRTTRPSYTSQDAYFSQAHEGSPRGTSSRILAALMDAETDEEGEGGTIEAVPAFWQKRIVPPSPEWRRTMETTSELNYGTSVEGDSEEEDADDIPRRRP